MPELPEVEVVVRSLNQHLVGQKIAQFQILRSKSFPQGNDFAQENLIGTTIKKITRRAKFIQINLDNGLWLLCHLKMTGQLIYVHQNKDQDERSLQTAGGGHPTADWTKQLPGNHTRIIITFTSADHLYFNDQRVFGWLQALTPQEVEEKYYSKLGPDANTAQFTAAYLAPKLAKKRIPIKVALMDNQIVCGLGNIYATETCFASQIDPRRPANQITPAELEKIVANSQKILAQSIKAGGTTFDGKYVDAEGKAGNFVEQLAVYGRAGQPCYRCQTTLENIRLGGRATVFCPHCQK